MAPKVAKINVCWELSKFDSKPPSMANHPTTINHPIACSSQGKSCWTIETTT
jgi:hypothetical protein